jgi:hypothetical protein
MFMSATGEEQVDIESAERIWDEYQRQHDLSGQRGQIAGIDPATGRIWIGDWFTDVVARRDAEGVDNPLFFVRIGSETALRKGGRR